MQELGGGSAANGNMRIEAGPGGYDNGAGGYGGGGGSAKPWEQPATGAPAPWAQGGNRTRDEFGASNGAPAPWAVANQGGDNYGYNQQSGYGSAAPGAPGGAAPWQQQAPANGGQSYGGYSGYPGYTDPSAYPPQPGMGAPPGLPSAIGGMAPPPGLNAFFQAQFGNGAVDAPPPPPPSGDAPPPPPPSDFPPPPPPS